MKERKIIDCGPVLIVATPAAGMGPHDGTVHVFPLPTAGVALSAGVTLRGADQLSKLREAIDHVLSRDRQS